MRPISRRASWTVTPDSRESGRARYTNSNTHNFGTGAAFLQQLHDVEAAAASDRLSGLAHLEGEDLFGKQTGQFTGLPPPEIAAFQRPGIGRVRDGHLAKIGASFQFLVYRIRVLLGLRNRGLRCFVVDRDQNVPYAILVGQRAFAERRREECIDLFV